MLALFVIIRLKSSVFFLLLIFAEGRIIILKGWSFDVLKKAAVETAADMRTRQLYT